MVRRGRVRHCAGIPDGAFLLTPLTAGVRLSGRIVAHIDYRDPTRPAPLASTTVSIKRHMSDLINLKKCLRSNFYIVRLAEVFETVLPITWLVGKRTPAYHQVAFNSCAFLLGNFHKRAESVRILLG
jgi:hypothetical protein